MRQSLDHLKQYRIRQGALRSTDDFGANGAFLITGPKGRLQVIASDQRGWEHVSVAPYKKKRIPTWEEMCFIKDLFWEPEETVVQYHPPRADTSISIRMCCTSGNPLISKSPYHRLIWLATRVINIVRTADGKDHTIMATIGFLRFDDFLAEIAGTTAPVRVEAYHQSTHGLMMELHRFYVECAAEVAGDTLVFRFLTSQWHDYIGIADETKERLMQSNAEAAALAVRQVLARDGFDVRPGLIAAAEESKTAGEMPDFVLKTLKAIKEPNNE